MRRRRTIRARDLPRLLIRGIAEVSGLFGGRYRRTEGAHLLLVDEAGRILAVRTTYLGPQWLLPGGRVERGERPHDAAVRETLEETGIRARVDRLLAVDVSHRRNSSFIFAGTVTGGDLEPQFGEIAEAGWLDRAEIATSAPRLDRLLAIIDAADGVAYVTGLRREPT